MTEEKKKVGRPKKVEIPKKVVVNDTLVEDVPIPVNSAKTEVEANFNDIIFPRYAVTIYKSQDHLDDVKNWLREHITNPNTKWAIEHIDGNSITVSFFDLNQSKLKELKSAEF